MLRSGLCDYNDSYILVKGTTTVTNTAAEGAANNAANKKVIFKNCALFTNCISRRNYTQVDDAHDIDVVIPTYNLIEYSDNYPKTSGTLWQYCRDEPVLTDDVKLLILLQLMLLRIHLKIKRKNNRSSRRQW